MGCCESIFCVKHVMSFTLDDIILPLAIVVIIDQKIREPERRSLERRAMGLAELFDISPLPTPERIREWFDREESELRRKLGGPMKNTVVLRALSKFKTDRDVEAVYDAMVSVSVSDEEYVRSESEIIKSAAAIWGFEQPPLKVVKPKAEQKADGEDA